MVVRLGGANDGNFVIFLQKGIPMVENRLRIDLPGSSRPTWDIRSKPCALDVLNGFVSHVLIHSASLLTPINACRVQGIGVARLIKIALNYLR